MKKQLIVVVLVGSLLACLPSKTHRHYKMPVLNQVSEITFHEFSSKKELHAKIGSHRVGKAIWSPNDNKCDVYFLAGDFHTLGHEVYHCFKGAFHEE